MQLVEELDPELARSIANTKKLPESEFKVRNTLLLDIVRNTLLLGRLFKLDVGIMLLTKATDGANKAEVPRLSHTPKLSEV